MPFYDLKCKKCNHEFNVMASMNQKENNEIPCPECGATNLKLFFKI